MKLFFILFYFLFSLIDAKAARPAEVTFSLSKSAIFKDTKLQAVSDQSSRNHIKTMNKLSIKRATVYYNLMNKEK